MELVVCQWSYVWHRIIHLENKIGKKYIHTITSAIYKLSRNKSIEKITQILSGENYKLFLRIKMRHIWMDMHEY